MEVAKLFNISVEYISNHLVVLLSTLRSTKLEFPPIKIPAQYLVIPSSQYEPVLKERLNRDLLSFVVFCVLVGSAFNTFIPGRGVSPAFPIAVVIVIGCWLLFSVLIHVICKFAWRGSLVETLSINLQVLAVIHVLTSFIAFLWGAVITELDRTKDLTSLRAVVGETLIDQPVYIYFLTQFVLSFIYLLRANMRIHGFSISRLFQAASKGAFSLVVSGAKLALIFIVFIAVSLAFVGLSVTQYSIHNILLSESQTKNLPDEYENRNGPQTEDWRATELGREAASHSRRLLSSKARYVIRSVERQEDRDTNNPDATALGQYETCLVEILRDEIIKRYAEGETSTVITIKTPPKDTAQAERYSRADRDASYYYRQPAVVERKEQSSTSEPSRCIL